MTPRKESLEQRAVRGDYDLIVPLDYLLMEAIPVEGTTLSGLYEIGETVNSLRKKFPDLSPGNLGSRLKLLEKQGLTRQVRMLGTGTSTNRAWQHTKTAQALIDKWKGNNGHGAS